MKALDYRFLAHTKKRRWSLSSCRLRVSVSCNDDGFRSFYRLPALDAASSGHDSERPTGIAFLADFSGLSTRNLGPRP